jgi:hypothetical protein
MKPSYRFAALLLVACGTRAPPPIVRDEPAKPAPSPAPATASKCGGYEGGKIGNYLVCLKLTSAGVVSQSTVDVGTPYDRKSDVMCGGTLRLWGEDYAVTCAQIPKASWDSVPSTDYALEKGGVKIPLFRRLNTDDGWWATVRMIGKDAFITFRFHKLD